MNLQFISASSQKTKRKLCKNEKAAKSVQMTEMAKALEKHKPMFLPTTFANVRHFANFGFLRLQKCKKFSEN